MKPTAIITAALIAVILFIYPGVLRYQYVLAPGGLLRVDRLTQHITTWDGTAGHPFQ